MRTARPNSFANSSTVAFALDWVGRETFAAVDVLDLDLIVFDDVRRFHCIFVNRARAFIVQFAIRDRGAVTVRLQQTCVAEPFPSDFLYVSARAKPASYFEVVDEACGAELGGG